MKCLQALVLLLFVTCNSGCANTVFILPDHPVIAVPESMDKKETAALKILIGHLKESAGKTATIKRESELTEADKKAGIIYLGKTLALSAVSTPKLKNDGYFIFQKNNSVYLSGQSGKGVIYAVYYFTEHFLNGFKPDEGPHLFIKKKTGDVPFDLPVAEEPAFDFRQAYFPASNKLEYQQWHHTQHIEDEWGIWGHNINKLITSSDKLPVPLTAYALIKGERNKEQFCFSSEELYIRIVNAIQKKIAGGNESLKWSIAPNDNAFVCEDEKCKAINHGTKSASNSVALLLNKLAAKFPDLTFTTLAYSTTIDPPVNIKLATNTIVILSTIDHPKGIALEQQKNFEQFNSLLKSWKAVCNTIYIWDYPIQYTNYFDVFPNIPALQKDLQYFKKAGIKGVFEQGSEYSYSIFSEWKTYAISKLLWNPALDLGRIRTDFFNNFYGSDGAIIEKFYARCESNVIRNKTPLDIYGNVQLSSKTWLNYEELETITAYLRKVTADEEGKNPRIFYNVHKLSTCLEILMLQYRRWKGIDPNGYATANSNTGWSIREGLAERIIKLKKAASDDEILTLNEDGILVQDYLSDYYSFLKTSETKNLLWKKRVIFNTQFDDTYPANGVYTLTDGMVGTSDYSYNWLLYNNKSLDIAVPDISISSAKKITITFLNDPAHYIFLPKSIKIFFGKNENNAVLLTTIFPKEIRTNKAEIVSFSPDIPPAAAGSQYLRIIAENLPALPEWKQHPIKKPTIACDEINIK